MQVMRRVIAGFLLMLVSVMAFGQDGPQVSAHSASQAAADAIRDFAGTDAAFLAAGLVNKTFDKDNLASLALYPTDGIAVLNLTGAELKQALERSVSLYPQPNEAFLQLSGIEAVFSKNAAPGQRIVSVTVNGTKLDEKRTYTVAMPASLAQGGLGYFKIWNTSKIAKTFDKATLGSVLKGKRSTDTSSRWSAVG
jgi:2',3'-cyclic-nucleotide 2'-phosphodiesterase (5'-nucleotidase family)